MEDIDPDTLMVVAGLGLSLMALVELYAALRNIQQG
jgi:hypothetical protein